MQRRHFLKQLALAGTLPFLPTIPTFGYKNNKASNTQLTISSIKVYLVKVNQRGNWYFIELLTDKGLSGYGEASHAFGGSGAQYNAGEKALQNEIAYFFNLIKGESPLNIAQFLERGWSRASQGKIAATAFSGIEQALWDLKGKALGVPVYDLLGGKLRNEIRVYANINRANNDKEENGHRSVVNFQRNAEEALKNGFTAVKLAPFDEMKALPSTPEQIEKDIAYAVSTVESIRKTIGNQVDLLIDVHSHLNRDLAIQVAKQLEPANLFWFEEPVSPEKFPQDMKAIKENIKQNLAGGESIFGVSGFTPLLQNKGISTIMPDVKHCGGIQELKNIAQYANSSGGIHVAPHNPSGPISTAASAHLCANIPNFSILEFAFGEVPWRAEVLSPAEHFVNGHIVLSDRPGFGADLNKKVVNQQI